jgi:acetyltransferase
MAKFFHPSSIAVVGASNNPDNLGYDVLHNILYTHRTGERKNGYKGEVYPISLKYSEILGLKAYKSIMDVPGSIDLAILIIPGKAIPIVMEECGQKGIKNVIIISAGFAERGSEGKAREREVSEIAKKYGIRFLGPNCMGVFSTYEKLNATFANAMPNRGPVAMMSQSGALCTSFIVYARQEHIGFSYFVSTGNKANIEDTDLIEYFKDDIITKVASIYMESLHNGRRFYDVARDVVPETPIVVLKVGKTEGGKKAASSHTGALAGADSAYEAAFQQAGVYRVPNMYDLFDATRALAYQPVPKGEKIAILTNSGGPGVIATDTAHHLDLPLADLSEDTINKLSAICPSTWSHGNPVDIIGDADIDRYLRCLDVLLDAPEVDGIIYVVAPTAVFDPLDMAKAVAPMAKSATKPIIATFVGIIGEESEDYLEATGVPTIEFPERAVRAMHALVHRKRILEREEARKIYKGCESEVCSDEVFKKCDQIFQKVRTDGRNILTLNEARLIFEHWGIPMSRSALATTEKEAAELGAKVGFPLAMKISSKDILHKTEVGGVLLEIQDPEGAMRAYNKIISNVKFHKPDARIEGVVLDQMVRGAEVIIGVSIDPQFGPMVMFGLGGTMVEVYKDVSFRLIPLTKIDALEMIEEIDGKAAYQGARGKPAADPNELAELIVKVSEAVKMHPGIKEIDINPLIVTEEGLIAVDARIMLNE